MVTVQPICLFGGVVLCFFFLVMNSANAQKYTTTTISLVGGTRTLGLDVDKRYGNYSISLDGQRWFQSRNTALHTSAGWFISSMPTDAAAFDVPSQTLALKGINQANGTDDFGRFEEVAITWAAGADPFLTKFKVYTGHETIVFEQIFPTELKRTAEGSNTKTISGFPTFTSSSGVPLRFLSYTDTFAVPQVGAWNSSPFKGGIEGGSPLILFNSTLRTLVLSPLTNFMVGSQVLTSDFGPSQLFAGIQGKVDHIPAGFVHATILHAGQGISKTVHSWGKRLLDRYHKVPAQPFSDVGIQYLGYWTDNGAYYYYNTEQGKNYQRTMTDIATYIQDIGLPVQSYQLDSWWYYKGVKDGLKLWQPMPSVFPDGMDAVDAAFDYKPLILHNRYFATDSDYESQGYNFINEGTIALPLDQSLFEFIMGKAKRWGLAVYEQDWLVTTYMNMEATQNNVSNANNWLLAMGNAARNLGLTIQYCMPLPIHLLASVQLQSVTQARASDDYHTAAYTDQWKIGYTSLFHWAIGLAPFKDDFWSTSDTQVGCPYSWGCYEPNPELQTLVAALSSGPVGPSDMIGKLNTTRIMQTCRKDGLLLKPDRPAFPLDAVFASQFGSSFTTTDMIELWHTETKMGEGKHMTWNYVLAAELNQPFTLRSADIGGAKDEKFVALNYFDITNPVPFNADKPLTLPAGRVLNKVIPFSYYVIAPILENKWVFLGERGKYVMVSKQRVQNVVAETSALYVDITGVVNERVELLFISPSSLSSLSSPSLSPTSVVCIIGTTGMSHVVCSGTSNSCTCN